MKHIQGSRLDTSTEGRENIRVQLSKETSGDILLMKYDFKDMKILMDNLGTLDRLHTSTMLLL